MDPNTMTIEQCLAYVLPELGYECGPGGEWWDPKTGDCLIVGLAAAAAAMPEGWYWWRLEGCWWARKREQFAGNGGTILEGSTLVRVKDADTELLARFRLAVACRMAGKGTA